MAAETGVDFGAPCSMRGSQTTIVRRGRTARGESRGLRRRTVFRMPAADHFPQTFDNAYQSLRLRVQFFARRRALLGVGGGPLRHLVHLGDRFRDLLDALRLLLARSFDLIDQRLHLAGAFRDGLNRAGDLARAYCCPLAI